MVYWKLYKKCGIECSKKWYQHMPEKWSTSANGNAGILWDVKINWKVRHSRQDITIKNKDARKLYFREVVVPKDHLVVMKENEKISKYLELAEKAQTEHHVSVEITPIVIGVTDTILVYILVLLYCISTLTILVLL